MDAVPLDMFGPGHDVARVLGERLQWCGPFLRPLKPVGDNHISTVRRLHGRATRLQNK